MFADVRVKMRWYLIRNGILMQGSTEDIQKGDHPVTVEADIWER
jgi:hypothetical protein